MIRIKRVFDAAMPEDGRRFLVDRLWPRGMSKAALKGGNWYRDVAPSDALRTWFSHSAEKWPEFHKRYRAELAANPGAWAPILRPHAMETSHCFTRRATQARTTPSFCGTIY